MSWQDRDYASEYRHDGPRRRAYRGSGLTAMSVTTMILIANIVVYFLMFSTNARFAENLIGFGVMVPEAVYKHGQVWRLFTATYMHAGFGHILFNMIGLYFLGPWLEKVWGRRQFFLVYTIGGVAGNVLLTLAGLVSFIAPDAPGLGASGSVLCLLGAAAVLFPEAEVYVYFILPVRIRTVVVVVTIGYLFNVFTQGSNYGGDLCHLAGVAVGLWWAYTGGVSLSGRHHTVRNPGSLLARLGGLFRGAGRDKTKPRAWQDRVERRKIDAQAVDRILAKVYEKGIHSLTPDERQLLIEATERQRMEEARAGRTDRL